jgi:thiol-disulfide isomerase/thioredoxin
MLPGRTLASVSVLLALVLFTSAPDPRVLAQQADDTDYQTELRAGDYALQRRQFDEALKAYKRASALKNKTDAAAHYGMARAYQGLQAHKNVIESSTEALKFIGDKEQLRASVLNLRGLAAFSLGQDGDQKRLKDAEADFRAVLALTDTQPIVRFNLGVALLRQGRDPEGIKELEEYVAAGGRAPEVDRARKMIANPRRARENFAPDFSFTSLGGEHIALEDLQGKVVLLDFWATWCPPCVAATPALKRLQKNFAEQRFVMLGISADNDANAWRTYVEKEQMLWPQYHDVQRRMARLFGVGGYPTYIVIDHEGIVRTTKSGWGGGADSWLHGEVRRYVKKADEAATKMPSLLLRPRPQD